MLKKQQWQYKSTVSGLKSTILLDIIYVTPIGTVWSTYKLQFFFYFNKFGDLLEMIFPLTSIHFFFLPKYDPNGIRYDLEGKLLKGN